MTANIPATCQLDAINVIYRGRFHIRLRPDGSGRWDAVSIIDGRWFREAQTPEEGIALAVTHLDILFPTAE